MTNRDTISGLFLTLLSAGACIMAYRLGLGTGSKPGPGLAPFGITALLGLMSIYLLLKGVLQATREQKNTEAAAKLALKKPVIILVILAGYGVFFNILGFSLSNFLLMMLLVWVVGRQKLRLALIVSLLTAASAYLLFVVAFGLPLPQGSLWYLFGE
jgi:putative tricarboxylic transport membrane protein